MHNSAALSVACNNSSCDSEHTAEPELGAWLCTKDMRFYSDGSIEQWKETEYDANGHKIKETPFKSDGSIYYWSEYEYKFFPNAPKNKKK